MPYAKDQKAMKLKTPTIIITSKKRKGWSRETPPRRRNKKAKKVRYLDETETVFRSRHLVRNYCEKKRRITQSMATLEIITLFLSNQLIQYALNLSIGHALNQSSWRYRYVTCHIIYIATLTLFPVDAESVSRRRFCSLQDLQRCVI